MECSFSKAGATEQNAKTLLQAGGQLKPHQSSGHLARPGAAPPDEKLPLLNSEHVTNADVSAGSEALGGQHGAQHGQLTRADSSSGREQTNEEEDGGKDTKHVNIEFNNPGDWNVDVIKKKMLAALQQFGLSRFDLDCFDFWTFDVWISFDDLESITDRSGSSHTSEQVRASLEEDEHAGVMFPLSARMKIQVASEEKPLKPSDLVGLNQRVKHPGTYHDESCDEIITSVALRRLLHEQKTETGAETWRAGAAGAKTWRVVCLQVLKWLVCYTNSAGRDSLLAAGCAEAVIDSMREGSVNVNSVGCHLLCDLCNGSPKRTEAVANAGAGEVLAGILATDRWADPLPAGYRQCCVKCIAMVARGSSVARQEAAEAGVVRALLKTSARYSDNFEQCAVALSFYSGDMVEESRASLHQHEHYEFEEGSRMDQVAAAADGMRYGYFSLAKDTLLPLADVCLDVVNAYTLYVEGHYTWLAAQLAALGFNGCASALTGAADGQWFTIAVDLLTFGTAGLVKESYMCFKNGVKSDALMTLKLMEACEAGISLAVTADTIVAAGTLPGYKKLTLSIAAVRFSSLAVSVASLSATAFDIDTRAVLSKSPCRHLRPILNSLMVKGAVFAHHVSEVSGLLVVVPLIQATRPLGTYLLAGACFILAASAHWFEVRSVTGDYIFGHESVTILDSSMEFSTGCSIPVTASGASVSVEDNQGGVKTLEMQASRDVASIPQFINLGFFYIPPQNLVRSEMHRFMKLVSGTTAIAGFARGLLMLVTVAPVYMIMNILGVLGRRFQLAVAVLRPVLWLAAWSMLVYRAAVDAETYQMVTTPSVIAILAMALIGMVAYVPLALHQGSQGRWLHFRQFEEKERPGNRDSERPAV